MSDLIKDTASSNIAQNPYADIDKLIANQNSLLEQQQQQQNAILDQQAQMQIDQINRNKQEIDENTAKTNSGLYAEYKKASNPYGPNAEQLYTRGLGNSGYAESSQTSLYNQYQKNITDTMNTANKLKADFDFQIQDAMKNRDLQKAQYALQLYQQKLNLLTQEYDLKNNKEKDIYNRSIDERNYNYQVGRDEVADNQWNKQFDYQQSRDTVADTQWEKQYEQMLKEYADNERWKQTNFDYQKQRDEVADNQYREQFDYQKSRDAVSDNQWEKEFALAQASKASSGSSRSSGGSKSSSGNTQTINLNDSNNLSEEAQELYAGFKLLKNSAMGKSLDFETFVGNAYNQGKINKEDASLLVQMYG